MPLDPGILGKLTGQALVVAHVAYRVAVLVGAGAVEYALDHPSLEAASPRPDACRRAPRPPPPERLGRRPQCDVITPIELLQPLTDELRGNMQVRARQRRKPAPGADRRTGARSPWPAPRPPNRAALEMAARTFCSTKGSSRRSAEPMLVCWRGWTSACSPSSTASQNRSHEHTPRHSCGPLGHRFDGNPERDWNDRGGRLRRAPSGSFVEIVIAYPTDSPDNFGVNMPMSVASDPLVGHLTC